MNKDQLPLPIKLAFFTCILFLTNLSLMESSVLEEPDEVAQDSDPVVTNQLRQQNTQHAKELIQTLYTVSSEDFSEVFGKKSLSVKLGTQAGYFGKEGTDQAYSPLVVYRRVWVSDAGLALLLAVQNDDPTADFRALWLLKNGQYTTNPKNPKETVFAGWSFSGNQASYGDNWTDCRFITGANACVLLAVGNYIVSDNYLRLNDKLKAEYSRLYADALAGILYHMESDGINGGLVTAGWSLNALEEFSKTNYSYNKILDIFGYGPREIDGFTDPIRRVRVRNVATEHCNNVLAVLNYTLSHYDRLLGADSPYTYSKLNAVRLKLRESIFSKLYDDSKRRFIAGRSSVGSKSSFTAIDNASLLSISLNLNELNNEQSKALSDSLFYTIDNLTKDFDILEKTYFGAHYFEDGFEDSYVKKSYDHSHALHVEATCKLICGLLKFANAFPDDPNEPLFRNTATKLWEDLQHFLAGFGFVYASTSIKDVSEPIEASVSAIWYLMTLKYVDENLTDEQK